MTVRPRPCILVTGFGPFGSSRVNSSEVVVRALARDKRVGRAVVLPVRFGRCFAVLKPHLCKVPHDALVCFGQSPSPWISVERVARNRDISYDKKRKRVNRKVIVRGGPPTVRTSLPVAAILRRLRHVGYRCRYSDDAGGYVCNNLFYLALRDARRRRVPCGFIHLPAVGTGGWTRRRLVAAGREIIAAVGG